VISGKIQLFKMRQPNTKEYNFEEIKKFIDDFKMHVIQKIKIIDNNISIAGNHTCDEDPKKSEVFCLFRAEHIKIKDQFLKLHKRIDGFINLIDTEKFNLEINKIICDVNLIIEKIEILSKNFLELLELYNLLDHNKNENKKLKIRINELKENPLKNFMERPKIFKVTREENFKNGNEIISTETEHNSEVKFSGKKRYYTESLETKNKNTAVNGSNTNILDLYELNQLENEIDIANKFLRDYHFDKNVKNSFQLQNINYFYFTKQEKILHKQTILYPREIKFENKSNYCKIKISFEGKHADLDENSEFINLLKNKFSFYILKIDIFNNEIIIGGILMKNPSDIIQEDFEKFNSKCVFSKVIYEYYNEAIDVLGWLNEGFESLNVISNIGESIRKMYVSIYNKLNFFREEYEKLIK
jgi:hypothetical protein